jgi:Fe-S-cluster containining protein
MNSQTLLICDEVKQIYDWLDASIGNIGVQCKACGKCCDFKSFGHRLYITTPELLCFKTNIKDLKQMTTDVCPYMQNGKCTAREFRFAGCRIFFCKANSELLSELGEQAVEKFKKLCDKYSLQYRYTDLKTALNG